MISKQILAFISGSVLVVLAIGAAVVYLNAPGHDPSTDAEGDNNIEVNCGCTPSHKYVDNAKYNLKLVDCSFKKVSSSVDYWSTTFTMDVNESALTMMTAFVGDVQIQFYNAAYYGHSYEWYFAPGQKTLTVTIDHTDPTHSGVALLEELRFVMTPVENGNEATLEGMNLGTPETPSYAVKMKFNEPKTSDVYVILVIGAYWDKGPLQFSSDFTEGPFESLDNVYVIYNGKAYAPVM